MTEAAHKNDKASHAMLNKLRSEPANAQCFDCSAMRPGWAVLPHGVFICMDCAQVHRHLGRHISQTKAINTNTYLWFPAELETMVSVGNARAECAFAACGLPPKPARDTPQEEKLAYVRRKYTDCTPDYSLAPVKEQTTPEIKVLAKQMLGDAAVVLGAPPTRPPPARPASPDLIDFEASVHAPPERAACSVSASSNQNDAFFAAFGL